MRYSILNMNIAGTVLADMLYNISAPTDVLQMHEIIKRGEEKAYGKFTTGTDH